MDEWLYGNKNGLKFDLYHNFFAILYELFLLSIGDDTVPLIWS
jgi:hypothetical protein